MIIETAEQATSTREWIARFEQTLTTVRAKPLAERLKNSRLRQAEEESLLCMIADLQTEVRDYELRASHLSLRNGYATVAAHPSLSEALGQANEDVRGMAIDKG